MKLKFIVLIPNFKIDYAKYNSNRFCIKRFPKNKVFIYQTLYDN